MSDSTPASSPEVFREAIASCGNSLIIEMARIGKWRKWYDADDWMNGVTEDFVSGRISDEKREAFCQLMRIGIMLGETPRDPKAFMHPGIPEEALTICAQTYRTSKNLREAALNPSRRMPRKDLYIAWRLGLITYDELSAAPPQFRGGKITQRKPAWQKR
jgi:hypothetical protein